MIDLIHDCMCLYLTCNSSPHTSGRCIYLLTLRLEYDVFGINVYLFSFSISLCPFKTLFQPVSPKYCFKMKFTFILKIPVGIFKPF